MSRFIQATRRTLIQGTSRHHSTHGTRPLHSASCPLSTTIPSAAPPWHSIPIEPFKPVLASVATPLKIGILGAGLTGLTLAHQLQRKLREAGRQQVEIILHERTHRTGGWVRSQVYQVATTKNHTGSFLLERGPRSFMYRAADDSCESTLQIMRQLRLGDQVILADRNAARRFVWNGGAEGKMVLLPAGIKSFWNFPHRSALIDGLMREWSAPAPSTNSDESVYDWTVRRFNKRVADELVDPMIAGIYAGDPKKLSIHSCLTRLPQMERRSGGIIRDMFFPSRTVAHERKLQRLKQFEKNAVLAEDDTWMANVRKNAIYSLKGGVSALTQSLTMRLQSDVNDPYASVLPGKDANVRIEKQSTVESIGVDPKSNKPLLHITDINGEKREESYSHVFSTLPSYALAPLISKETVNGLSLSQSHRSLLSHTLNLQSMPFASVWVVNIVYDYSVLPPEKRGFGLLIPTIHTIPGLEVLGITFDSCVFPEQNSLPSDQETRLTVMLGGDRFPEFSTWKQEDIEFHALKVVQSMLGISPLEHRPILVDGMLNQYCIPQYYVGHTEKVQTVLQTLQHLAHTPTTLTLPEVGDRKQIDVPLHAAALASAHPEYRPFTLLGTSFCGVSLNDCIHHATASAEDFVKREIQRETMPTL